MRQPGSRTRSTDVWLLEADEDGVGAEISARLPEARWRCSHAGPASAQPRHRHPTVREAMDCGGTQAFLDLPVGRDPFTGRPGAAVQLLASAVRDEGQGPYLRGGRLAVRWVEPEVGPDLHALLSEQTDAVWAALRSATEVVHLVDGDGRSVRGRRIGSAARALVLRDGLLLGPMAGLVRYRLA